MWLCESLCLSNDCAFALEHVRVNSNSGPFPRILYNRVHQLVDKLRCSLDNPIQELPRRCLAFCLVLLQLGLVKAQLSQGTICTFWIMGWLQHLLSLLISGIVELWAHCLITVELDSLVDVVTNSSASTMASTKPSMSMTASQNCNVDENLFQNKISIEYKDVGDINMERLASPFHSRCYVPSRKLWK